MPGQGAHGQAPLQANAIGIQADNEAGLEEGRLRLEVGMLDVAQPISAERRRVARNVGRARELDGWRRDRREVGRSLGRVAPALTAVMGDASLVG